MCTTDSSSTEGAANAEAAANQALDPLDDSDGRPLFSPKSRWSDDARREHKSEGFYIGSVLVGSLVFLSLVGLGGLHFALHYAGVDDQTIVSANRYALIGGGGLLGGTVYGGKWIYHAVAKGLWHQDRKLWRYLSPWISLGTTVGIGALIEAGFMPVPTVDTGTHFTGGSLVGLGFLIGYLSDRFLAKMKDLTEVLFGPTEQHGGPNPKSRKPKSKGNAD